MVAESGVGVRDSATAGARSGLVQVVVAEIRRGADTVAVDIGPVVVRVVVGQRTEIVRTDRTVVAAVAVAVLAEVGVERAAVGAVQDAVVVVIRVVAVGGEVAIGVGVRDSATTCAGSGLVQVVVAEIRRGANTVTVDIGPVVVRVVVGEWTEVVRAHRAVVAAVAVAVLAEIGIQRVAIRSIEDTIVVVVGVAGVTRTVTVGVRSVVVWRVVGQGTEVVRTDRAVVAAVTVGVLAQVRVERTAVGAVQDTIVVVVRVVAVGREVAIGVGVRDAATAGARSGLVHVVVAEIRRGADTVTVDIRPVVVGVVVGEWTEIVRTDRTVVAAVAVRVLAEVGIQRVAIRSVEDAIVVVIRVVAVGGEVAIGVGVRDSATTCAGSGLVRVVVAEIRRGADTVTVDIRPVVVGVVVGEWTEVVRAHRTVVAAVAVAVLAEIGVERAAVGAVQDAVVVVVGVAGVTRTVTVGVRSVVVWRVVGQRTEVVRTDRAVVAAVAVAVLAEIGVERTAVGAVQDAIVVVVGVVAVGGEVAIGVGVRDSATTCARSGLVQVVVAEVRRGADTVAVDIGSVVVGVVVGEWTEIVRTDRAVVATVAVAVLAEIGVERAAVGAVQDAVVVVIRVVAVGREVAMRTPTPMATSPPTATTRTTTTMASSTERMATR